MLIQLLLTHLLLLMSGELFNRGQWLSALIVLLVYITTLIMVIRPRREGYGL